MPYSSVWSRAEVPDFIALWEEVHVQAHLNTSHLKAQIYKQLSGKKMKERGYNWDKGDPAGLQEYGGE